MRRLQSVLNAAARVISNKRKFDHITPVLRDQLHWLPIRQRIEFKIAVCPQRLPWSDLPQPHLQSCPGGRRQSLLAIRSSRQPDCATNQDPSLRSYEFPCLCTGCLEDIRIPELSLERFKSMLKTHLFGQAYANQRSQCFRDLVRGRLISVSYIYIYIYIYMQSLYLC